MKTTTERPDRKEERRAYLREFQRKWMAKRRKAWLDEHPQCVKCGSSERLEVDHIDPATKVHHCVWSWSQERRDAELEKCQVLCRACHHAKTGRESRERMLKHGTPTRYMAGKCRCEPCRAAYSSMRRRQRAARKEALAS